MMLVRNHMCAHSRCKYRTKIRPRDSPAGLRKHDCRVFCQRCLDRRQTDPRFHFSVANASAVADAILRIYIYFFTIGGPFSVWPRSLATRKSCVCTHRELKILCPAGRKLITQIFRREKLPAGPIFTDAARFPAQQLDRNPFVSQRAAVGKTICWVKLRCGEAAARVRVLSGVAR